ncbi:MAG: tRNA uridine-5-carboxymethylaminomethyl(34) synthesis GTPase MnmE, partial [Kiritimatiellaeota bacterium]|nr:tRNA uridine-5-carboxymethylaminomethyl(34) synthesis GTPase MnmE [Kiritimatiellota bacterium]
AAATLTVFTKSDLQSIGNQPSAISVSAVTGAGIPELKKAIAEKLLTSSATSSSSSGAVAVSARHHALLREADESIASAINCGDGADSAVICAQSLRSAAESLGRITGRTYTDDLLDKIFSRFCVGK